MPCRSSRGTAEYASNCISRGAVRSTNVRRRYACAVALTVVVKGYSVASDTMRSFLAVSKFRIANDFLEHEFAQRSALDSYRQINGPEI